MSARPKKYIFVTGGVASSLGKGLAAASLGGLLERRGIKINILKMDPYINVDPGTMSPTQHGEVYVTDDGAETDLDLGHYERFTSLTLSRRSNFTTGQVYMKVIEDERKGNYLGKTVQVVPHITDEIKRRIHEAADGCDLLISEIGGTVGDIESLPFLESIRQFALDVGTENVLFVHLVLLPWIEAAGELKTKPAQHSVKELRSIGLNPNIIICRSEREIEEDIYRKLSLFCNVPVSHVFKSLDVDSIYKVPLSFAKQGLDQKVIEQLGMWAAQAKTADFEKVVHSIDNPKGKVRIGIVGKYTDLTESYKSLGEALAHGAIAQEYTLEPVYLDAEKLQKNPQKELEGVDGVLVPGGFGERGTEGKIQAIRYARENNVPFFGICLGMQLAVVEYFRNVIGLEKAMSEEFGTNGDLIIHYMEGQTREGDKGGSMRLGAYDCDLAEGSLAAKVYQTKKVSERHRHRLEVNNKFVDQLEGRDMTVSGKNSELGLVEIVEITNHPFFLGCQFHPEFKSRPTEPHPIFREFIKASIDSGKK